MCVSYQLLCYECRSKLRVIDIDRYDDKTCASSLFSLFWLNFRFEFSNFLSSVFNFQISFSVCSILLLFRDSFEDRSMAPIDWKSELNRMLDSFEQQSAESLDKIHQRFGELGLPFNDAFRKNVREMVNLRCAFSISQQVFVYIDLFASSGTFNNLQLYNSLAF